MKHNTTGVAFEDIEKVASEMLTQGVKPTVRGVIAVTGGKTEVVSKYLRDFFDKRDLEVSKMSDEIGSSSVAKLIAGEIQLIVDRRTATLAEINARQKEQINEYVELLEEKVAQSLKIETDAQLSVELANKDAAQKIEKVTSEAAKAVEIANKKIEEAIQAKRLAETQTAEIKLISENRVKSEQEKAAALIEVANSRAQQADQETKLLREQVKALSIDEAKRDIERSEFINTKEQLSKLQLAYAEQKTEVVKLLAEKNAISKDVTRLESDNSEYKLLDKEYIKSQTQLVEYQKQITELNNKITLSERERESLTLAVSMQGEGKR